jgi:hypothetical protein
VIDSFSFSSFLFFSFPVKYFIGWVIVSTWVRLYTWEHLCNLFRYHQYGKKLEPLIKTFLLKYRNHLRNTVICVKKVRLAYFFISKYLIMKRFHLQKGNLLFWFDKLGKLKKYLFKNNFAAFSPALHQN